MEPPIEPEFLAVLANEVQDEAVGLAGVQPEASPELLQEWEWSEHFAAQPDTLRYLNFVADKFDLRRDIQFNATVVSAHWREPTRDWEVTLQDGSRHTAPFLITAIGPLSWSAAVCVIWTSSASSAAAITTKLGRVAR